MREVTHSDIYVLFLTGCTIMEGRLKGPREGLRAPRGRTSVKGFQSRATASEKTFMKSSFCFIEKMSGGMSLTVLPWARLTRTWWPIM